MIVLPLAIPLLVVSSIIAPILKDFSSLCHALPLLLTLSQNRPKDDRTLRHYYAVINN
nr:hypothetical protein [uncultured Aggregatibacter sp.]